jgi:chromate transporter
MASDSPPTAAPAAELARSHPPHEIGLGELFLAFAKISLAGFGGVLVWARRAIVEQHRWMTADEFNETYALCHFLPGPNIVNLSVVFGSRFRGIPGGIAAFAGLVGPPMLIAIGLVALYVHYGEIDALRRILAGVASAAVGLLIGVVFKMIAPLVKRRDVAGLLILVAAFVAIGFLRWPLPMVLLAGIPLSLGITLIMRRPEKP